MSTRNRLTLLALCFGMAAGGGANAQEAASKTGAAGALLRAAGVKAGLCVHIGDPLLAAALCADGRFLAINLSPDGAAVEAGRKVLQSLDVYGPVTMERCNLTTLPLADNLVNLVVVDDVTAAMKAGLSPAEIARVLCPNGVALFGKPTGSEDALKKVLSGLGTVQVLESSSSWLRFEKPRPAGYDEWTHPGYSADNSRVSRDAAVGPPRRLQWLAGPTFPVAANDFGYEAILSAGGRNYYVLKSSQSELPSFAGPAVIDEAAEMPRAQRTGRWLVARDAYNGLPLWRRAYDGTANTLVVDSQHLYTMLGGQIAVIADDTGKVTANYGKVVDPLGAHFLFQNGQLVIYSSKGIQDFDTHSGKQGWSAPLPAKSQVLIENGTVVLFDAQGKTLTGLSLASGKEAWKSDCSTWLKGKDRMLFGRDGLLAFDAEGGGVGGTNRYVSAASAKDGKALWTYAYEVPRGDTASRRTVLYADGLVWVQKWMVVGTNTQQWVGLDPTTGKSTRMLTAPRTSSYGCHADIATEKYVVFNRPADFMSLEDGTVVRSRAVRPACIFGATLANGLFYTAPNVCVCVLGNMHGFVGMAAAGQTNSRIGEPARLEAGTSQTTPVESAAPAVADWPTFRHDPSRSSSAPTQTFSPMMKILWTTPVVGPRRMPPSLVTDEAAANWTGDEAITAPTVSGEKVFVGCPDRHRIVALDAHTGRQAWSAVVGGRVDVPPTLYRGLCLTGCRDGWVYALAASDGALAWRFRVAPEDRRIVAFGQLESPWPVVGGVMVRDGLAYALAGRTSESDGGVHVCCLEPATGNLHWEQCPTNDPAKGFVGLADLLVADDKAVSCGGNTHCRLDPKTGKLLGRVPLDAVRAGTVNGQYYGYLQSTSLLLDRTWHFQGGSDRFNTQWMDGLSGQIVVFDKARVVARQHKMVNRQSVIAITAQSRPVKAGEKPQSLWSVDLPSGQDASAITLARDYALVGIVSADGKQGSLLVLSLNDGTKSAEYELPGPPASEGIAVAEERVYVATSGGQIVCFGRAD